jgi:ferrochelatase
MNDLWATLRKMGLEDRFRWSVIDRWPLHEGYIDAVIDRINTKIKDFEPEDRDKAVR